MTTPHLITGMEAIGDQLSTHLPNHVVTLLWQAMCHRGMNRVEEAVSDLNQALALYPDNVEVLVERAALYRELKRYALALDHINCAPTLDDTHTTQLTSTRGLFLSYLGRYEEAFQNYEYELQHTPDTYRPLYNIAVVRVVWKGVNEAQPALSAARAALAALANTPVRSFALYGLGGLAAMTGQTDEALRNLQQAMELDLTVWDWAEDDIAWQALRTDPRFQALMEHGPIADSTNTPASKPVTPRSQPGGINKA